MRSLVSSSRGVRISFDDDVIFDDFVERLLLLSFVLPPPVVRLKKTALDETKFSKKKKIVKP